MRNIKRKHFLSFFLYNFFWKQKKRAKNNPCVFETKNIHRFFKNIFLFYKSNFLQPKIAQQIPEIIVAWNPNLPRE